MTQITAGVPASTLNSTSCSWRRRIHVMPDGYRAVVASDGTNITVKTAANGTAWSTATTIVAGTALTALMDTVVAGNNLYLISAGASSVAVTRLPYSGSGAWGAAVTTNPLTALAYTPQSVRAVYDSTGATNDSQHTSGTGLIHLLVDAGANWYLYALDPNSSGVAPKSVLTTTISTGITTPTYATNMILRQNGRLYALSSAGSNGWKGFEIDYTSTTTTNPASGTAPPASHVFDTGGKSSGPWFLYSNAAFGNIVLGGSSGSWNYGYQNSVVPHNPISTAASGSYGATISGYSNVTIPAGTWGVGITANFLNCYGIGYIRATVYELTVGGSYIGIASLSASANQSYIDGSAPVTLNVSGTLPQHTFQAGSSLWVAFDFLTLPGQPIRSSATGSAIFFTSGSILTPTPTAPPSTITSYSYTVGSAESPGLPASNLGAALSVAGADSVSNPVDIFVTGTNVIAYIQRNPDGSYAALQNLTATGISGTDAPSASSNQAGNTTVFAQGTFSGALHVGMIRKQSGLWGSYAQAESSAAGIQPSSFAASDVKSQGAIGNAVAYVNGPNPYNLIYEDNGFASGAVAPTVTNVQLIPTNASANDVFGVVAPFNATTVLPLFQFTYNEALAGDALGSFRVVVARTDVVSTVWDSGQVAAAAGTVSGGNYQVQYGAVGAAATPLVVGGSYTVTVYAWDTVGGNGSAASTAVAFNVVSAPVVSGITPQTITSQPQVFSFNYAQAQSLSAQSYQIQLIDASGAVQFDTGNTPQAIAAGSTFTTPALTLPPSIVNNTNYTIKITVYVSPSAGASWSGTGSAVISTSFPTPPPPSGLTAVPVPGADPLSGGYDLLSWSQGTENMIANGDLSLGGNSATFYQDPFSSLSGWDSAVGVTVSGNIATLAATTGILSSQSYWYNNNALAVRFYNTASTKLSLRFMLPGSAVTGYSLLIDSTGSSIQFQKLVAGASSPIGTALTTALTASTWYWAVVSFAVSGSTTTLSATVYNDSSGAQGTSFGSIGSFTDTSYTAPGGISVANLSAASQQIGGNADGSGFRLTGPSPASWTALPSPGVPCWSGWFMDGGVNVLAGRQVSVDSTAYSGWRSAMHPIGSGVTQLAVSADVVSATSSNALFSVSFYDLNAAFISSSGLVLNASTGYSEIAGLFNVPSNAASVQLTLEMPFGAVGEYRASLIQLEGSAIATSYRNQSGAVLKSNRIYQRNTGGSAWVLAATVPAVAGLNALRVYSIPNALPQDFMVTSVSSQGYESSGAVVTGITLTNRVGIWLNEPANPTNGVELGVRSSGDAFMQLEPVQDKDQAQLFLRSDIVPTVGTMYSFHVPEIVYQLEQGYEQRCMNLLRKWDQQGTILQFRSPWGDVFNAFIVAAKQGAQHIVSNRSVAIELQASVPGSVVLPTAQVSSDTSSTSGTTTTTLHARQVTLPLPLASPLVSS